MRSRSSLRRRLPISYSLLAVLFMAVTGMPTHAQSLTPDFAGRWRADKPSLVLDITPCGAGWCGIEVTDKGACGREMLRLSPSEGSDAAWHGRLELAAEALAYAVEARLVGVPGNKPSLMLVGHAGRAFQPMRRVMPLRAQFVRSGEPACRSQKPVS